MYPEIPAIGVPIASAVTVLGALTYGSIAPSSSLWGPAISSGSADLPARCALTFDDGPTPGATDRILDILGEEGTKAAFFVIGRNVAAAPDLLKRIRDEGHVVCNHSWDHPHFGMMRARWYWNRQIRMTDDLIEQVIGLRPAIFRPPMGVRTGHITGAARRAGHKLVTWSLRANDGFPTTPERILNRLTANVKAGDILLMHDGIEPNWSRNPKPTIEMLRPLIRELRSRGVEPRGLEEVIGVEAYQK